MKLWGHYRQGKTWALKMSVVDAVRFGLRRPDEKLTLVAPSRTETKTVQEWLEDWGLWPGPAREA